MKFSAFFSLVSAAVVANACSQCPHPGNFTGSLSLYPNPTPNFCQTTIVNDVVYASIPATYWNPPDESPCEGTIVVTNPNTGATVVAEVVGECTTCAGNNILLTTNGLAALAPDADPNHSPATVGWTFNN